MLQILALVLGPLETNAYLLADDATGKAAVIDPAWDGGRIADEARTRNWRIGQVWITHAHFDHIGGVAELVDTIQPAPVIHLHPEERPLWDARGLGEQFGIHLPASPPASSDLVDMLQLQLGKVKFEVRHTPGHTPGHCIFYCAETRVCFCGDLIFKDSVGRSDLPGGSWEALKKSIREQIFSLPDETRLLPGHGPETRVGREKKENEWVRGE